MVCNTPPSQDVSTYQIWNPYLKESRRYAPDTKRDGQTDGQCKLLYASQSSFGGIKSHGNCLSSHIAVILLKKIEPNSFMHMFHVPTFSTLISMCICLFTQINFQKKAIKIDFGRVTKKAKEIQFTQYNQIVMGTGFYYFAIRKSDLVWSG